MWLPSTNQACLAQVLDKQKQLDAQSFWDNRDWDWYKENIPFFECPDADITTTYYYRWELVTKHLTYGSPTSGYSFTEFIDRPFWSGAYGATIKAPSEYQLEAWTGTQWQSIANQSRNPKMPTGHRSNTITFEALSLQKLRVTMSHATGGRTGLAEIELWGLAELPYVSTRPPAGNLAFNPNGRGFPKATASHSDRFGGQPMKAIDGKIVFLPTPVNRWT